jgi:aquaporin NIP
MPLNRRCYAELIGTFIMMVCGCGAIVVNQATSALTHPGIAIVWGLVVLALIYAIGDLSGAHMNPAVTLGFAVAKRFPWVEVPAYLLAQFLAAVLAAAFLKVLFPGNQNLGATMPVGTEWQSFLLELFLTWFLMLGILGVSTGAKEKGITAGIAVGSIIGLEAMFAGPICGASMNPARSFGPALVSGKMAVVWIYLIAPTLGAFLAVPTYQMLNPTRDDPASRRTSDES